MIYAIKKIEHCRDCEEEGSNSRSTIKSVNNDYNTRIMQILKEQNTDFSPLELGCPCTLLLESGVKNIPLQISVGKLKEKMNDAKHQYRFLDVVHLPDYLSKPIAVFHTTNDKFPDRIVVLTEMVCNGNNFVVILGEWQTKAGNRINSVVSIYPKDNASPILGWIKEGLLIRCNKQKFLEWFSKQLSNSTDLTKPLKECANIIALLPD